MNTKKEIFLDNYIAKPIAFLLNYLTRLLGKIMNIDHRLDRSFERIYICKFKGMGSIIQSTPLIAALKQQFPSAKITFVTTKSNVAILKTISDVDDILAIDDSGLLRLFFSTCSTLLKLIKAKPEVYIDLEIYSNFSTLITLFSLAKNRIGFYLRSSSFRMGIYTHMMFFNVTAPISTTYLQIARLFGELKHKPPLFPIHKNIDEHPFNKDKKYIVINPNASDLRIERRWGKQSFKQLTQQLLERYPEHHVVMIGAPNEASYTQSVIAGIQDVRLHNLAGETSINELIAIIKHADLVITNDTGPMHIAFACQTKTVCLFGPCSPEQYADSENIYIIYKKVYCSPCVHEFSVPPCDGKNVCMELISLREVNDTIAKAMDDLQDEKKDQNFILVDDKSQVLGQVNRAHGNK